MKLLVNQTEENLTNYRSSSQGKYQNAEIANLIQQINKYPQEESNYISLIYYYSKNDAIDKVLETAQNSRKQFLPQWAQVSLFKYR
jgi:hypothetical protein